MSPSSYYKKRNQHKRIVVWTPILSKCSLNPCCYWEVAESWEGEAEVKVTGDMALKGILGLCSFPFASHKPPGKQCPPPTPALHSHGTNTIPRRAQRQQGQVTTDWNRWNREPKSFLLLSWSPRALCHSDAKMSGSYLESFFTFVYQRLWHYWSMTSINPPSPLLFQPNLEVMFDPYLNCSVFNLLLLIVNSPKGT